MFLEPLFNYSSFIRRVRTIADNVHKNVYDNDPSSNTTFNTILGDFLYILFVYK